MKCGKSSAVFTLSLSSPFDHDLKVPLVVADADDANFLYRDVEGGHIVTVPAGTQSFQLGIPTRDDANDEADGSVSLDIDDAALASFEDVPERAGYRLASDGLEAEVSVADNDDPSDRTSNPPAGSNRCRNLN